MRSEVYNTDSIEFLKNYNMGGAKIFRKSPKFKNTQTLQRCL